MTCLFVVPAHQDPTDGAMSQSPMQAAMITMYGYAANMLASIAQRASAETCLQIVELPGGFCLAAVPPQRLQCSNHPLLLCPPPGQKCQLSKSERSRAFRFNTLHKCAPPRQHISLKQARPTAMLTCASHALKDARTISLSCLSGTFCSWNLDFTL